jgi:predicted metal-dependent phosphoesterase TrpH
MNISSVIVEIGSEMLILFHTTVLVTRTNSVDVFLARGANFIKGPQTPMRMSKKEERGRYANNIVRREDVPALIAGGYKAMDPHLHTSSSADVFPSPRFSPTALYEKMRAEGFGFITFTDHDTMDGYARLDSVGSGLDSLIRGVEIKIKPAFIRDHPDARTYTLHNNVYCLSDWQFGELEALAKAHDFYGFIDYCRRNELPLTLNHPTWCQLDEMADWTLLPDIIREYDVIEVYNRGRISQQNGMGLKLAERFGKGMVSSSDSHIGLPIKATLARGADFREYWEHVKAGESLVVPGSADYRMMREQVLGWIRAFGESDRNKIRERLYIFDTGSRRINTLISYLTGDDIEERQTEKRVMELVLKLAVYSVGRPIINSVYLSKQRAEARRIEETLGRIELGSADL